MRKQANIDQYYKNRHPDVYPADKDQNVQVWQNTKHLFTKGRFKHFQPPISQGYSTHWRLNQDRYHKPCEHTIVKVWNCDTLVGAKRMIDQGFKPAVLNMASNYVPGGGVRKGSRAQEECLFRRSNYFLTLDTAKLPHNTYPLEGCTAIYSPACRVIKGIDNKVLDDEQQFNVDFIAIAGLRRPKLNNMKTSFRFDDDRDELFVRVERIYQVALDNNHDSMLLGALGCGAFKNPVEEVVQAFKFMNEKYDGYFKRIDFAVLSEKGNPNYNVFYQQLVYKDKNEHIKNNVGVNDISINNTDFPPLK